MQEQINAYERNEQQLQDQVHHMATKYKKEKETNREILELNMEIMANHQKQIDIIVFNNEQHQSLQEQLESMVEEQDALLKQTAEAEVANADLRKENEKLKSQNKCSELTIVDLRKEIAELRKEIKNMIIRESSQKPQLNRKNEAAMTLS